MTKRERWLLPEGVEELLPERAAALETLRRELLDLYESWGYDLVIPPLIEYLESLLTGTGNDLDLQTFKLTDQLTGRLMGVRADITPQVARIDAHRLDSDEPRRLCYIASALNTRPDGLAGSRVPLQAGAELFGHAGLESDLEIVSLMLETLEICGLDGVHLDLGHVGVYRALTAMAGLDEDGAAELFGIMQRKAVPELEGFLGEAELPERTAAMLRSLPELNGGREVLDEARRTLADAGEAVEAPLDELERLIDRITADYPRLPVHVDLCELRGYHYHTGVVFTAFQAGHGQAVARGGRYDDIGRVFGRPRPATGFSADLMTLLARSVRRFDGPRGSILAPAEDDPALTRKIRELRGAGERVVRELPGAQGSPDGGGPHRRLVKKGGRWRVEDRAGQE